jgi:hypothetical protein
MHCENCLFSICCSDKKENCNIFEKEDEYNEYYSSDLKIFIHALRKEYIKDMEYRCQK